MATASDPSVAQYPLLTKKPALKEGILFKRQRGQTRDSRKLKFQQRYVSITQDNLSYYKISTDHKKGEKRGDFPVSRMRIIEKVTDSTFCTTNCFQIGDNNEVMYFRTKTENERKEWMEAFAIAATLKKNKMFEFYHMGAYGQVNRNRWSCCNAANRDTPGCQKIKVPQVRRKTMSFQKRDRHTEPETEFIKRSNTVGTFRHTSVDTQSIDSGYVEAANKFGGSQFSITSRQSDPGSEMSHSPLVTSKVEHEQKTIPEDKHLENELFDNSCEEPQQSDSIFEVTSAVFRGTNKLVIAYQEGPIRIFDTKKFDEGEYISSGEPVGSMDIWKHYLVIGCFHLRILNLNYKDVRKTLELKFENTEHPNLVAFTPGGKLLSYNQSQPNTITLWPQVESLWSASDIRSERCLKMKNAKSVNSLLVSPNPRQPWLAVSTTNPTQLQIYDYSNERCFKNQLELPDNEKVVTCFTPTGEYILVGRGRNLTLFAITSLSKSFSFPAFEVPITKLAYNLWSSNVTLAIGFSNGKIDVYNAEDKYITSLNSSEKGSSTIICLAYSNDGETLVSVSSNGKVKLQKVTPSISKSRKQMISLVREGEMTVDSKGKQYISPDDGYAISVPPGAIAEGKTITFKYGVVPDGPFGPFEFPDGVRPVSAIISLHPTTEEPLLKPIEMALPHFIHCETKEDQKRLGVFKADCHRDVKGGKTIYCFKDMTEVKLSLGTYNGDPNYPEGIPYAKYSTTHGCFWCIGEYGKDETDRAIFSLIEVKPKILDQHEDLVIHYCLPYFLPTCHKTIREQYPEDGYDLNIQSVKFSANGGLDSAIGINFQEKLGSWLFSLQGGKDKKIYQNDICFWDYPTPYYLKEMCKEKIYPPRFSVLIRGAVRPDNEVRADFIFPGAEVFPGRGEPIATIYLPLQIQRMSVSTESTFSRLSPVVSESVIRVNLSVSSPTQPCLQPAAQAFKACMCDLDDLHPSKLALNLFSNDLIDEAYFVSIQESMKSNTKDEMVIRNEILLKIYSALKTDATLGATLQQVLRKLSPNSAGKFASTIRRLSSDGSVASIAATTQEDASNESEILAESDAVFNETLPDEVIHTEVLSSTLTSYSPIQFHEQGILVFNSPPPSQPFTQSDLSYQESHPEEET